MNRVFRSRRLAVTGLVLAVGLLVASLAVTGVIQSVFAPLTGQKATASTSLGDRLNGTVAPAFTLTDQFGHTRKLSDFRGKVVVLAFIDSRCTDTCPVTAAILKQAYSELGNKASQVQLVAVNANPVATKVSDVLNWSNQHGMTNQWLFLTGPASQLKTIWADYHIESEVEANGDVSHTPAVYLLDRNGKEQWLNLMNSSKSSMTDETVSIHQQIAGLLSH